jgi:hypothetical protein
MPDFVKINMVTYAESGGTAVMHNHWITEAQIT